MRLIVAATAVFDRNGRPAPPVLNFPTRFQHRSRSTLRTLKLRSASAFLFLRRL
ncbi:MAG: hypothetical protein R3293_28775 [Candidatus Promineifilaceae bacterium]|nr:hypothetical protein [Candidatus Promineifilaceae bacterium]